MKMNNSQYFVYLLIVSLSTYLIRAIPFSLINKKINNRFINSFLCYIPYTVLASMTFPAALYVTGSVMSAAIGLIVSLVVALKCKSITLIALIACVSALIVDLIMLI